MREASYGNIQIRHCLLSSYEHSVARDEMVTVEVLKSAIHLSDAIVLVSASFCKDNSKTIKLSV